MQTELTMKLREHAKFEFTQALIVTNGAASISICKVSN
jgi:hypothetical protein